MQALDPMLSELQNSNKNLVFKINYKKENYLIQKGNLNYEEVPFLEL